MFRLFSSKDRTILGIDIRSSSIQIVQLSYSVTHTTVQYNLEHYAHVVLPEFVIERGLIKQIDIVKNHLRDLLAELPEPYERVIMAVPTALTISKILLFHHGISDWYLEELIRIEAQKNISSSHSTDFYIDFKILGPSLEQTGMIDVLMVATRSEMVKNRVGLMQQMGLDIHVMDIDSYAIERVIPWIIPEWLVAEWEKHIVAIHIELTGIQIWVLRGMKVIFSHEALFNDVELIQPAKMNALIIQKSSTMVMEQDDYQSYRALVLDKVTRALQFFFSSHIQVRIDYMVLLGDMACPSDMEALFEHYFSIPTRCANPFAKMSKSPHIDDAHLSYHSPALAIACGLALRTAE